MKLIFIHGPAAAGKLTVGRALHEVTGFKLFHNHLVVDALLAVFPFGSEPFIKLRQQIWLSVFDEAAAQKVSLIFTFAPEATVQPEFITRTISTVRAKGGDTHFVELTCPIAELEKRIDSPSRSAFQKLKSIELFRHLRETGANKFPPLPSSGLTIDTNTTVPQEAAERIVRHFKLNEARA